MMDMTLIEILKGALCFGILLGLVAYLYSMFIGANRLSRCSKSYLFTRRFGVASDSNRQSLRRHMVNHGMSWKQSADCMNSWNDKAKEEQFK